MMSHTVKVDHETDADFLIGNSSPFSQSRILDTLMRPDAHAVGVLFIAIDMSFRCELISHLFIGIGAAVGL